MELERAEAEAQDKPDAGQSAAQSCGGRAEQRFVQLLNGQPEAYVQRAWPVVESQRGCLEPQQASQEPLRPGQPRVPTLERSPGRRPPAQRPNQRRE